MAPFEGHYCQEFLNNNRNKKIPNNGTRELTYNVYMYMGVNKVYMGVYKVYVGVYKVYMGVNKVNMGV